jgi:poly(3-hydroxyoctanoate) depolymerase
MHMSAADSPHFRSVATEAITIGRQQVRVAVREGDGSRPPLLLLNGIGAVLEALQPFVDALPPATGVIRFDIPGVGGSPAPRAPYRLWRMSALVARLLDELGHERADVLGVSWGGALAQQFAFQRHRRCRRLILVSTAAIAGIPPSATVLREMMSPRRFEDPDHARAVAARLYGGRARTDPDVVCALQRPPGDRRGYRYQQLALVGWTSVPFARFIRQRTLILTGDDDPIVRPVNGAILHRLIRNAELHVFHDGHLGLITSAEVLVPRIEEFLERS